MNNFSGLGRIGKELELKSTNSNKSYVKFSLAIKRDKDNTDWINCIAWEKTAELITKHFNKGDMIGVTGRVQSGSYDKDGQKVYTFDVVVNNISFCGKKEDSATGTKFESKQNSVDDSENPFPF